jgi:hypothetical protein
MLANNYQHMLCNITEELRPQLHCSRGMKSHRRWTENTLYCLSSAFLCGHMYIWMGKTNYYRYPLFHITNCWRLLVKPPTRGENQLKNTVLSNQVKALENAYTYNQMHHNLETFGESSNTHLSFKIWPVHAYHKLVFRLITFKKLKQRSNSTILYRKRYKFFCNLVSVACIVLNSGTTAVTGKR